MKKFFQLLTTFISIFIFSIFITSNIVSAQVVENTNNCDFGSGYEFAEFGLISNSAGSCFDSRNNLWYEYCGSTDQQIINNSCTSAPNGDNNNQLLNGNATGCDPNSSEAINLGDCLLLNEQQSVQEVYSDPSVILNTIVSNVFILAGIIAFFLLLYSGFTFINGGKKGMEDAKQIITTAIIGFGLMFAAYWIIQILQIMTGQNLGLG